MAMVEPSAASIEGGCNADVAEEEGDKCWICHGGPRELSPLKTHCKCHSLKAHDECIAHWQLRNAGTNDELK